MATAKTEEKCSIDFLKMKIDYSNASAATKKLARDAMKTMRNIIIGGVVLVILTAVLLCIFKINPLPALGWMGGAGGLTGVFAFARKTFKGKGNSP